ncbi:MAG TPA: DHA2 family efflux MFS transporter permease subunit [Mycobacterium sp.]|nr:DHA2 family efflux MFS transporter permease subunit [Mycobacterium sp.]
MLVGFFMILVDATIVAVANPSIMDKLGAGYDSVIWVTSAYLLAYAVPLLVAGRLGDRFGPKNLYLLGLTVFTAASLWCGLAGSIEMLIAARVVQGIGAALLTPQTLSTITRIFPADRRGVAMSVWGATAGVATLVGPLAGGVLVDRLGWQWIFFVNVPVGIIGLALAVWLIPVLPTQKHRFDLLGVLLSGIGMFMIVFALQEGQSHHWAPWIWGTLAGGIGFAAAFLIWQSVNRNEPLIPLVIFRDRDFSLSALGVATIGFVATATFLPLMFYAQAVCGLSPTRAALLTAPMAIATGVLAPFVGKIVDRSHPRPVIGFGFSVLAIAMTWLSIEMQPTTPIWRLVLPVTAMGIGSAFIWAPLAATATRNLPPQLAGAGSGVYNATRQVGSVLGSAGMAAFMTSRLSAEMPPVLVEAPGQGSVTRLPGWLHEPFAAAMSQSMLLPAFFALFGVVAAMFLLGFGDPARLVEDDDLDDADRNAGFAVEYGGDDAFVDDDEYLEYTVSWDDPEPAANEPVAQPKPVVQPDPVAQPQPVAANEPVVQADDWGHSPRKPGAHPPEGQGDITEPMRSRAEHLLHAPAETWHGDRVESWHSLLKDETPAPDTPAPEPPAPEPPPEPPHDPWRWGYRPPEGQGDILDDLLSDVPPAKPKGETAEPIGFAHNGFHVDEEQRFQPLPPPAPERARPSRHERSARHYRSEGQQEKRSFWFDSNGRHSRDDPDDASSYGKHSMPGRD